MKIGSGSFIVHCSCGCLSSGAVCLSWPRSVPASPSPLLVELTQRDTATNRVTTPGTLYGTLLFLLSGRVLRTRFGMVIHVIHECVIGQGLTNTNTAFVGRRCCGLAGAGRAGTSAPGVAGRDQRQQASTDTHARSGCRVRSAPRPELASMRRPRPAGS
jgi:hypothetical protein